MGQVGTSKVQRKSKYIIYLEVSIANFCVCSLRSIPNISVVGYFKKLFESLDRTKFFFFLLVRMKMSTGL